MPVARREQPKMIPGWLHLESTTQHRRCESAARSEPEGGMLSNDVGRSFGWA